LRAQKIDLAVKQGEAYVAKLSKNQWTLRLEIACQHETMAKAVAFFGATTPDLWIRPMNMKDGRGCYQVFLGHYPSRAAAEAVIPTLPAAFRAGGNRPKPFQIGELVTRQ
ncbi:MAG: hypothetical protein LWX11_06625, partial [Firmicutes bacterium]|nr:hypothetical protein [Bacillota bacterium]